MAMLSLLRSFPVVRFRAARCGSGWVLSGVPVEQRVAAFRLLYAAGCRALSPVTFHGAGDRYAAFHLACPEEVVRLLWSEFGSYSKGAAGQFLPQ